MTTNNSFAQLFGGFQSPQINLPTFSDPKKKYMSSLGANMSTPSGPALAPAPNVSSPITANPGATSTKPVVPSTPAKQQFVQSQVTTPQTTTPNYGGTQNPNYGLQTDVFNNAPPGTKPQTPQTPAVDPKASYRAAFDSYLASLNPSSEETAAQDRLTSLTTQDNLDHEKALQSGETLSYATGLAGQQARTAGIMESGAANTLAAITGRREATTNAQKARLDFEKSLLSDTPDSKPFQAGDTTYQYDPESKTYKSVGTKAVSSSQPASVQEYEYAKANGYKGTFTDYQNDDANRKRSIAGTNSTTSPTEKRAESKAQQEDDVASAIVDFQTQMQQKNWKGANPEAYKYYRDELTKLYGAAAALALDKAMTDAGIEVDRR